MRQLITFAEAQEIILSYPIIMEVEKVNLTAALDRVLAEPVIADHSLPPFDRSPLDGFAVRSIDTQGANRDHPVVLEIIEEVPAGKVATKHLEESTAVKVTTGAPLPVGTDAIIAFEQTEFDKKNVNIFSPIKPNSNICIAGEDVQKGETVISAKTKIAPEHIGIMAALGLAQVPVYRKPKIAILSTGDELIDISQPLASGKIRNSNMYNLGASIEALGCEPVLLGMVSDDLAEITTALKKALAYDLVITTGGVSVGDYDLVKEAMNNVGATNLFWRVDIRPGTPIVCNEIQKKLLIGLSGNPAAALITFELLVKPLINKSFGLPYKHKIVKGTLTTDFNKNTKQMRFLRAKTKVTENGLVTALTGLQNSGVMKSVLDYNSLIRVPVGTGPLKAGTTVEIFLTKELEVE